MTRFHILNDGPQRGSLADDEVKGLRPSGLTSGSHLSGRKGASRDRTERARTEKIERRRQDRRGAGDTAPPLDWRLQIPPQSPRSAPNPSAGQPVTPGPSPIATTPTPPPLEARATPKPPSYEEWFIQSVRQYETGVPAEGDEARISYNRGERARGISNSLPGIRTLSGWNGILRKVQSTIDGKVAIAIELPGSNILLQTWSDRHLRRRGRHAHRAKIGALRSPPQPGDRNSREL